MLLNNRLQLANHFFDHHNQSIIQNQHLSTPTKNQNQHLFFPPRPNQFNTAFLYSNPTIHIAETPHIVYHSIFTSAFTTPIGFSNSLQFNQPTKSINSFQSFLLFTTSSHSHIDSSINYTFPTIPLQPNLPHSHF